MGYEILDTVVLVRDLAEHGLRAGDLGVIVETYPPDGLEIEFVTVSGSTVVVATVRTSDIRLSTDCDA